MLIAFFRSSVLHSRIRSLLYYYMRIGAAEPKGTDTRNTCFGFFVPGNGLCNDLDGISFQGI